ncbi:nuclear pore protein-like protein [Colletotrichum musicola]|uniref:Nuclear pore protein-like protein n=1 Tax=Colletotrichum musicola TaxID=2175873 RepID=A0A8H6JW70_9PEZI|nr:nuclear pore protein-like protein [Colletotrichum musicola]
MFRVGKRPAAVAIGADASRRRLSTESLESVHDRPFVVTGRSLTTIFDDLGDLQLEVGSDGPKYQVYSRTLARASPVFKEMLYGLSAEPRPTSDTWVVKFSKDQGPGLDYFLNLCHGRWTYGPPPASELPRLFICLEKYDAIQVVQPFVESWTEYLVKHEGKYELLWTTWTLGDSELFRTKLTEIAGSWTVDRSGNLLHEETASWSGCSADEAEAEEGMHCYASREVLLGLHYGVQGVTETDIANAVLKIRKSLIDAALAPYRRLLNLLEDEKDLPDMPDLCKAVLIGRLILGFNRSGLGNVDRFKTAADAYRGTVDKLVYMLKTNMSSEKLRHCEACDFLPVDIKPGERCTISVEGGVIDLGKQDWLKARAVKTGLKPRTGRDFWSVWEARLGGLVGK